MTIRSMRSGISRLVLGALLAVTVIGGTLAFGTLHPVSAAPSSSWCASQAAGVDRYLTLSGQALSEGNIRSAFTLLATANAIHEASVAAGCGTTAL